MYNGEEDILDIRLNTLSEIVDKFIILESPVSHSKLPRELEYPKQKTRFKKFENKINYYIFDYCKNDNFLLNDWTGREVIESILINKHNLTTEDLIIHGDLDEIIKPELLQKYILSGFESKKPYTFMIDSRQLCLDLELVEERNGRIRGNFPGSMLLKGEHLKDNKLYWLRQIRCNPIIQNKDYKDTFNLVDNAGWHFSYCAGIEKTIDKFKFFCHANEMEGSIKDKDGLINCIRNKVSFGPNKIPLIQVNWDKENMPEYVLNNPDLFKEILSSNY
jgi:beta-1,4-mannosyl-glycoprotein beta-1,4-N-acetylglucosaminyltransferase